jgi:hypothetical protein
MRQNINTAMREAMSKAKTQLFSVKCTALVRFTSYKAGIWSEELKAGLPAVMQNFDFPLFFMGAFDAPSYEVGLKLYQMNLKNSIYPFLPYQVLVDPKWIFNGAYFHGTGQGFFAGSPPAYVAAYPSTAFQFLKLGDLVLQYDSSDVSGYYQAFVIITCDKMSYQSFLQESSFKHVTTRNILYFSDNLQNYNEPINIMKFSPVGLYKIDQYNALASKPIDTVQQDFIKMDLQLPLDRYMGLYTRMKFNTNLLALEFNFNY